MSSKSVSTQSQVIYYGKYLILTAELYHSVKSFDEYVKHVISILIKMKFHVRESSIKWLKLVYQRS